MFINHYKVITIVYNQATGDIAFRVGLQSKNK